MPFPGTQATLDARVHREEQLTLARTTSQLNTRNAALDPSLPAMPAAAAPTQTPLAATISKALKRRRVVLPDPVALR